MNQEINNRLDPIIKPEFKIHTATGNLEYNTIIEIIIKHSKFLPVSEKDRGSYFTFIRRFGQINIASLDEIRQLVMASENNFVFLLNFYKKRRGERLSKKHYN